MEPSIVEYQSRPQHPIAHSKTPPPRFGSLAHLKRAKSKAARAYILAEATRRARHYTLATWRENCWGRMAEATAADLLHLRPDLGTISDDAKVAMHWQGDFEFEKVTRITRVLWIVPAAEFDPKDDYCIETHLKWWREGDSKFTADSFLVVGGLL
jgi:hypothetical protein